jgi:hypothetical protein
LQWARSISGASLQKAEAVTCDAAGNFYISGAFKSTVIFGNDTLVSSANDLFISRVNAANGNITLTHRIGCKYNSIINDIHTDPAGNLYLTGSFADTLNFGLTDLATFGGSDIFLAKFSMNGMVWARHFGSMQGDVGYGIRYAGDGILYATGTCQDTSRFGTFTISATGSIVMQADTAGNVKWVKNFGQGGVTPTHLCTKDGRRNFVYGAYSGNVAIGTDTFASINGHNLFLSVLDSSGTVTKTYSFSDTVLSHTIKTGGLAMDAAGNAYFGGWFNYTTRFGSTVITAGSGADATSKIFVGRLGNDVLPGIYSADEPLRKNLRLFPNPCNGTFYINADVADYSDVMLVNTLGATVHKAQIMRTSLGKELVCVNAELPAGLYHVILGNHGERIDAGRIVMGEQK